MERVGVTGPVAVGVNVGERDLLGVALGVALGVGLLDGDLEGVADLLGELLGVGDTEGVRVPV
jgi:hypothetical protein